MKPLSCAGPSYSSFNVGDQGFTKGQVALEVRTRSSGADPGNDRAPRGRGAIIAIGDPKLTLGTSVLCLPPERRPTMPFDTLEIRISLQKLLIGLVLIIVPLSVVGRSEEHTSELQS